MGRIKKALVFIVALHVIAIVMTSCCTDYEDFYWTDFSISVIDNSSRDGFQQTIFLDVNNPIEKAKLGFQISPDIIFPARQQASRAGIISEAQATSCGFVTVPQHAITSIVIIARSENSEGYQVEVNATSLFRGRLMWEREVTISELISQLNCKDCREIRRFNLLLRNDSIDLRGKHIFEITITFDDGVVLVQKTEELELV